MKSSDPSVVREGQAKTSWEFAHHGANWLADSRYLADQLSNSSEFIRQQAAGLLASLEMLVPTFGLDSQSQQSVYSLLSDPVQRLRLTAIRILVFSAIPKPSLTNDQATHVLELLSDESPQVRRLTVEAVLSEKPLREQTVKAVVGRFDMDPEVQENIIETLGRAKIDSEPSASLLHRLLKDRTGASLIPVLDAIGQIGGLTGQITFESMRQLSEASDDASIRKSATEALRRIQTLPKVPHDNL